MKLRFMPMVAILLELGCSRPANDSHISEAPDFLNAIEIFNIHKVFTYSDLLNYPVVKTPTIPWTDTYWPSVKQGLAWRYAAPRPLPTDEGKLASFLDHFIEESQKQEPDPLLSPAEKYDLVFNFRHSVALPLDALKVMNADFTKQGDAAKSTANLADKRPLVRAMGDQLLGSGDIEHAMSMTVSSWGNYLRKSSYSGNKYLGLSDGPGDDWSWEGLCGGWAPAAVMSSAPKHSVMALAGDKKVFFSEGDLRGLLTKSWDEEAPGGDKSYFLGRRCEYSVSDTSKPMPANALGKGYTGSITLDGKDVPFVVIESLPAMVNFNVDGRHTVLNSYRIQLDVTHQELILLEDFSYRGSNFWTVKTFGDMAKAVKSSDFSKLVKVKAQLSGCWDPNPASFHQILVEQIGNRKYGFAMDRTRTGQVWNQPIYGAKFNIGELVPVGSVNDIAATYRASGTAYLAQVYAKVYWSGEPSKPSIVYGPDDDSNQLEATVYSYTLEFDAKQRVIGGEWGTFDVMDPSADAPDYLFGYVKDSVPDDEIDRNPGQPRIDYSGLIGKLHGCSLTDDTDGKIVVRGKSLPYKTCTIEKAVP